MEEATFLAKFGTKVTIIHRRDVFRASPIMVDRAKASERIEFVLESVVEEVLGDDAVTGVVVRNLTPESAFEAEDPGIVRRIAELADGLEDRLSRGRDLF